MTTARQNMAADARLLSWSSCGRVIEVCQSAGQLGLWDMSGARHSAAAGIMIVKLKLWSSHRGLLGFLAVGALDHGQRGVGWGGEAGHVCFFCAP